MAQFKWGLFWILIGSAVSAVAAFTNPYIVIFGLVFQVIGYLIVFLDTDVWDRPALKLYLDDMEKRLMVAVDARLHAHQHAEKPAIPEKPEEKAKMICKACFTTFTYPASKKGTGVAVVCGKCGKENVLE